MGKYGTNSEFRRSILKVKPYAKTDGLQIFGEIVNEFVLFAAKCSGKIDLKIGAVPA